MKYPGGKNHGSSYPGSSTRSRRTSSISSRLLEGAAIRRFMKPCRRSILIDLDPGALGRLAGVVPPGTEPVNCNALTWLELRSKCRRCLRSFIATLPMWPRPAPAGCVMSTS